MYSRITKSAPTLSAAWRQASCSSLGMVLTTVMRTWGTFSTAVAVNFKMAVTLCKEFLNNPNMTGKEVMQKISRNTVPIRPGRQDERNLRAKGFGWFTYRIAA